MAVMLAPPPVVVPPSSPAQRQHIYHTPRSPSPTSSSAIAAPRACHRFAAAAAVQALLARKCHTCPFRSSGVYKLTRDTLMARIILNICIDPSLYLTQAFSVLLPQTSPIRTGGDICVPRCRCRCGGKQVGQDRERYTRCLSCLRKVILHCCPCKFTFKPRARVPQSLPVPPTCRG